MIGLILRTQSDAESRRKFAREHCWICAKHRREVRGLVIADGPPAIAPVAICNECTATVVQRFEEAGIPCRVGPDGRVA